MAYNLIQFQHGLSLPDFIQCQHRGRVRQRAKTRPLACRVRRPAMRWQRALRRGQRVARALPVQRSSCSDLHDG